LRLSALEAPRERAHDVAYNVGRDEDNYQVRDIAEIVRATVPGARMVYAGTAKPDVRSNRVDFDKIRRELPEFAPAWDVGRGAAEIHEACRRCRLDRALFEGRHLVRLVQLRHLLDTGQVTPDLRWNDAAAIAR